MAYDPRDRKTQLAALAPASGQQPTPPPPPATAPAGNPSPPADHFDFGSSQAYGDAINHGVQKVGTGAADAYHAVTGFLTPDKADLSGVQGAAAGATAQGQAFGQERAGFTGNAAPQIDQTQAQQIRQQQLAALGGLQAAANGTTPSAAALQAEQTRQANVANQFGLAAAMRGRSPGASLAQASRGAAAINAQAAGQGAQLRAAEQAQARNALVGALGGVRTQDTGVATDQAQLALQQGAQNQDWQKALLGAQVTSQGQGITGEGTAATAAGQQAAAENSYKGQILGGIGGGLALLSDKRTKEGVRSGLREATEMLDALSPESFRYKDEHADRPGAGPGRRLGVMAQDLERSPMGRAVVIETTPKQVDVPKALSASLAALAALNHRVRGLEAKG